MKRLVLVLLLTLSACAPAKKTDEQASQTEQKLTPACPNNYNPIPLERDGMIVDINRLPYGTYRLSGFDYVVIDDSTGATIHTQSVNKNGVLGIQFACYSNINSGTFLNVSAIALSGYQNLMNGTETVNATKYNLSSNQSQISFSSELITSYRRPADTLTGWSGYRMYQVGGIGSNQYELRQYRDVREVNGTRRLEYIATKFTFTAQ